MSRIAPSVWAPFGHHCSANRLNLRVKLRLGIRPGVNVRFAVASYKYLKLRPVRIETGYMSATRADHCIPWRGCTSKFCVSE